MVKLKKLDNERLKIQSPASITNENFFSMKPLSRKESSLVKSERKLHVDMLKSLKTRRAY